MSTQPSRPGTLALSGVSKSFEGVGVLSGAELSAGPGAVVGVVGANGSGKTTLLRLMAGVLDPDAGSVQVAGGRAGKGAASWVPAGDRMLTWRLDGRRNLSFFGRLAGIREAELGAAVSAAASWMGAEPWLDRPLGQCSTGQRRRVMLALGFLTGAPVVLLDEPYADLDAEGCAAVAAAARSWADAGGLVVWTAPQSHEGPTPDVSYRLDRGRVVSA